MEDRENGTAQPGPADSAGTESADRSG